MQFPLHAAQSSISTPSVYAQVLLAYIFDTLSSRAPGYSVLGSFRPPHLPAAHLTSSLSPRSKMIQTRNMLFFAKKSANHMLPDWANLYESRAPSHAPHRNVLREVLRERALHVPGCEMAEYVLRHTVCMWNCCAGWNGLWP